MEFEGDHPNDQQERGGGGGGTKTLLIVLGVVGGLCLCCCAGTLGGAYFLGQEMLGPLVEFQKAIVQAHQDNPWSQPEDSRIESERLEIYLLVRRQAVEAFRESSEKVKEMEAKEQDPGIGDALNVASSLFSAMKAWPEALVEHGMNPDEFRWFTEQAYGAWLPNQPDPGPEVQKYTQLHRRVFVGNDLPAKNVTLFETRKADLDELAMFEFDKMVSEFQGQ